MAKVEIKGTGDKTEVFVDGVKVHGVFEMNLLATPGKISVLILNIRATEIMADIDKADVNIDKREGESN